MISSHTPENRVEIFGITQAVRIFVTVSKDYPAHAILQGIAINKLARKQGIPLEFVKMLLGTPEAVDKIVEAANAQSGHQIVDAAKVRFIIEGDMKWAILSNRLSLEEVEILLRERKQEALDLKRERGSTVEGFKESARRIVAAYFPEEKLTERDLQF